MLDMVKDVNPLIIDVAFVAIMVLILFFGIIRGFKKVITNVIILSISLFLGFTSFVDSLKVAVENKILANIKLYAAGSSNSVIFASSLFLKFLSSFIVFLLFYLVIKLIVILIGMLIRRKTKKMPGLKSKVSRIFGGLISFVYGGCLVVLLTIMLNTNIIGMKSVIKETTVMNFVSENSSKLLNKIEDDFDSQLILKVIHGDVLVNVETDELKAYETLDENFEEVVMNKKYVVELDDKLLIDEEVRSLIKDKLIDLNNIAIVSKSFAKNNDKVKDNFKLLAEEWLNAMKKNFDSRGLEQIEYSAEDIGTIRSNLIEAGVEEKFVKYIDDMTKALI